MPRPKSGAGLPSIAGMTLLEEEEDEEGNVSLDCSFSSALLAQSGDSQHAAAVGANQEDVCKREREGREGEVHRFDYKHC